eukprot:289809_1
MNRSLCNALALVLLAFSLSYWMIHHQTNPGMIETILALIVSCVAVAALNLHRPAATAGIDPATVAKCKPIDAVKALMTTTTTSKYIRPKQTSKQRGIRISGRDLVNRTRNTDGWPIAQTPLETTTSHTNHYRYEPLPLRITTATNHYRYDSKQIHRIRTTTATIRIHTQIQMHRQPECGHTTSNSNPTNDRQKSPNPQTQTTITAINKEYTSEELNHFKQLTLWILAKFGPFINGNLDWCKNRNHLIWMNDDIINQVPLEIESVLPMNHHEEVKYDDGRLL